MPSVTLPSAAFLGLAGPCVFPGVRLVEYRDRHAWLQGRRNRIQSSDVAAIFGEGYSDQSPVTIYSSKILDPTPEDEERVAKRLKIGKRIEPALRAIFEDETEWPVQHLGDFSIVEHPEISWLGASLDGVCEHPDHGPCPVETKNVGYFNRKDWQGDEPPLRFNVQCQTQLAVTGASHAFLFGLIGGNEPHVVTIPRDERFIDAMLRHLETFWGFVERQELPHGEPWDSFARHQVERSLFARLFPEQEGEEAALPDESAAWHIAWEDAKARKKAAEDEEAKWGNKLRAAIAEASYGRLPGGQRLSFKTTKGHWVERYYVNASRQLRNCK